MGLRRRAGSRANGTDPDPGAGGPGSLGAGFAAAELVGAAQPTKPAKPTKPTKPTEPNTTSHAKERKPLTAAKAKRLIGVGTAVAPLLAPYAMAAAGAARARWDAHRAARLGIPPDQLVSFASRGGALHARLSRIAETLTALDERGDEARRFAADVRPRLADLAVAVRAAEQMPSTRRRHAFRAIGDELDRIEADLLTHLGVDT
ncbi:MAG: DUF6474 family protein [Pseudonocardia sp.]